MNNPKSQVSGYPYSSSSQLSELPDIKKWFSSYTYNSPVLDTNEDFCFTLGVDDEERRLYVEDTEIEKEGKCEDLTKINRFVIRKSIEKARKDDFSSILAAVEVPANPDSLSLPSEPPDITKWFSSYVYNSPDIDSADFDISLSSGYNFGNKEEVDKGREDHLKELPVKKVKDEVLRCTGTISRACGIENNKNPPTSQEDGTERSNLLSSKNSLCPERISYQRTVRAEPNISSTILDKSAVCPTIKAEDLMPIVKEEQQKGCVYNLGYTETNEDLRKQKSTAAGNDSSWISLNHKPRGDQHCRSRLNLVNNKASSGRNKENCPVKSVCSSDGRKDGMLRKDILKETTNFDVSRVPEVAGKWRCPQKDKPDTGPPMKQLRLERWVHRI
ncbi:hypothetical protein BVRB_4g079500 [Beta vulgaris subsp. vulgaris]|uniref:uncharacterized protein LOC104890634 n=1 Tax=Beta vulgaris subsp. vulgaris TaxID=3555 RepID=UPI00053FC96E|nr:uncharacterized protein LOC104890634 [Beta vulgaris subsp. vulgaris]KMT14128.1 hypothetical protein BVRB_4g079500 [Beta vulgaris subsp. vulgaris]